MIRSSNAKPLPFSFYQDSDVTKIAKNLLGKIVMTRMYHPIQGVQITAGRIVETEAYSHKEAGCHSFRGITKRNAVMFEAGGVAYVYLCYGIHTLFNIVTNIKGRGDAVLVRAVEPLYGQEIMIERTGKSLQGITSGPGKLTRALGIGMHHNGCKLHKSPVMVVDDNFQVKNKNIVTSKRIGLGKVGEASALPWRYYLSFSTWVSPFGLVPLG